MRKPVLLFITRKWAGHGGMQQLSRDLWRGMWEAYGERARLCFLGRQAIFLGLVTVWRGGHVHLGDAALAPFGWLLKRVGRGRVTVTACGLDVVWPRRWYQWLLRRTLPCFDHIVCISQATAEHVRRRGIYDEKIVVIPCGVWIDVRNFAIAPARDAMAPFLLTVGRLIPRKGVPWFVREVVPGLFYDFPHLQYWIIGRGPEELLIKKFVQEKSLEHCVHLCGEVDDREREEFFREADIFVAPNIAVPGDMEGFGIVCIEASARGVPVVAARCDGLSDAVIDGKTGRLFASGNAEDCARVIRQMFEKGEGEIWDRERARRATLERYGWSVLFQRYRDEVFGF